MIPGIGAAGPLMKALNKLPPSVLKNLDKFLEALGDILKKLDLKKILDGASGILEKLPDFITKKDKTRAKELKEMMYEKLGGACFTIGSLVYSKQGYTPIEEIKVGDLIYAKDPVTGAQGLKEVRQVFERKVRKLIHIELEEVSLSSTLEHPFWVYGKGFIKAEDLEVGDALVRYEAYESTTFKTEKIKNIEISYHEDPVTVYNFEVEAWHSYFVSEQGIWVHNAKCQAPKQKGKAPTKKGNPKREPPKIKRNKDGKIAKKKNKLVRPAKGAGKTGKYQVGLYEDIKGVPGLDAHHVGQKAVMKNLVKNYDPLKVPAINIPKVGHTISGTNGIVSRSTKGITSARQLLARDLFELKRVYPDIPNSVFKEIIEMNKQMYPEMLK